MITCPRCSHQNPDEAPNCELCGAELQGSTMDATLALDVEELESVSIDLDGSIKSSASDLEELDLVEGDLFELGDMPESGPSSRSSAGLQRPSLRLPGITSSVGPSRDSSRNTSGLPGRSSATKKGPQGLAKLLQAALDTSNDPSPPPPSAPLPENPRTLTNDNLPGIDANIPTGNFDADEAFSDALVGALNQSVDEGMFAGGDFAEGNESRNNIPGAGTQRVGSQQQAQPAPLPGQGAEPPTAEVSKIPCPSCDYPNPPGMYYCINCGNNIQDAAEPADEHLVKCPSCGHNNAPDNHFCGTCGYPMSPALPEPTPAIAESSSERARVPAQWDVKLVSINEDGSDGVEIPLNYSKTVIGRSGDTRFPTDAFLSPKHASLTIEHGDLFIEDLYSLNGTFVKIRDEVELSAGDLFLMGRQVLRFEKFEQTITPKARASDGTRYMGSPPPGGQYKLLQVGIGGVVQNVYCIPESGVVLGREKGEIIFPRDKFMSGRHAQIYLREDDRYCLVDLNSSNGTWIKIWEKTQLHDTDFIFLGQQLFRVEHNG
ncbi:MAG: hypothetical protein CMH57_04225 [Myxococcales bacterium]|nr:hypothetical protein [Myxococcales bacterium]